ncbi:MAG: peptide chain release factor N(5)-glutamine methyltransferase, partial [Clostridia bacterium]|nr:peptide chain release factor N(5)-glutamine methyltransferase [Clostridia bacterium]
MTYRELCREGVTALTGRFPDTADFIARELLLGVSGLSRADYPLTQNDRCPPPVEGQYRKGILELLNGRPLQYLLGEWDFYGLTFSVGEGVLIPRPETELLVDSVLDYQRLHPGKPLRVLDLCAGSGCIGLTMAHEGPEATVIAVEKSPEAFSYLKKNAAALSMGERYLPVPGDILEEPAEQLRSLGPFDVLVSNPPY